LNKDRISELAKLALDKVSQALINQLPFYTGLLFVTTNYSEYYQIITIIFLCISFGNLGLEKAFANSRLDVVQILRKIIHFRIVFGFFVFLILKEYLKVDIIVSFIGSLIVLFNFTTLGEFLYVGKHLKYPLITVKVVIITIGLVLRYVYNETLGLLIILLFESLLFSFALFISLRLSRNYQIEFKPIQKSAHVDTLYSLLLLGSSFLVTRMYVYYDLGLSISELKYLHLSDYVVVVASFAGSVIIRLGLFQDIGLLLHRFFITALIVTMFAVYFDYKIGYYFGAKVISAINVLYIYLMFTRNRIKHSFLINIGSLIIMLSFLALVSKEGIFKWMLFAEFSVIAIAFILSRMKLG
jgi:hypothetical protein